MTPVVDNEECKRGIFFDFKINLNAVVLIFNRGEKHDRLFEHDSKRLLA